MSDRVAKISSVARYRYLQPRLVILSHTTRTSNIRCTNLITVSPE